MCAREHASDDVLEEAVVPTMPNGVLVFVCVKLAAAECVAKEARLGQRTRPVAGLIWRVNFINGPIRQNWN
jgi:hypothetical protein